MVGRRTRARQRAAQRAALNRPRLDRFDAADVPASAPAAAPPAARRDWPAIRSRHPRWWQVERIERCDGRLRYVLIAETETETQAFTIMSRQLSQTRVYRFGDRRPPFVSWRQPLEKSK